MKLTKSLRTLGLMAMLTVIVGTSVQQTVQAQTRNPVNPASKVACAPLPQGQFFNEFEGMTFSQEQDRAFRRIAAAEKKDRKL